MRTDDLKLISDLGKALYSNPETARTRSVETVAAVSTLERLTDEQSFEKAIYLLFKQAENEGSKPSTNAIAHPFYRLSALERGVLALLHSGRVSYARLARILGVEVALIEKLAWASRTKLASSPEVRASAPHPTGSSKVKHACPEYFQDRPWTQKLLDDEMKPSELAFIQNHTFVCAECSRALAQAREFYYAVEKWVPTADGIVDAVSLEALMNARARAGKPLSSLSIGEALGMVFRRLDVRIALGVFLFTLVLKFFAG